MAEANPSPAMPVRLQLSRKAGFRLQAHSDGFLHWVSQRDFDEDVLFTVRHEIGRRRREAEVVANAEVGE